MNNGRNFQTEIGPREENCPSANSRKNSGRPARTRMMTYGIRKLAATSTKHKIAENIYFVLAHHSLKQLTFRPTLFVSQQYTVYRVGQKIKPLPNDQKNRIKSYQSL